MSQIRSYTELVKLKTFKDRFEYLKLGGLVGKETFGWERIYNQRFYASHEWKEVRRKVIVRDNATDLGCDGYSIPGRIIVHHLNPIKPEDLLDRIDLILDPEYLITTCFRTHNAIHYGDDSILYDDPIIRTPGDTIPW